MSGQNLSLRRKSASRLALVQCLYRARVTDETFSPEAALADIQHVVKEGQEGDTELFDGAEPDFAFLKKLLCGIAPELPALASQLKEHLAADWKLERMSPLLVAILKAGLYELKTQPKPAVIIDEYTRIARGFFDEDEVNFVHGILHKLAEARHPAT